MRITAASLMCALLASPAMATDHPAPSFDCARATTPVEHLICGSSELSSLDTAMADAFRASREPLDDTGRAASIQMQRQWLQSRFPTCGIPTKGEIDPAKNGEATACLIGLYKQRVTALQAEVKPAPAAGASPSGTDAAFDKSIFPATGSHEAILTVPAFGRYAILVKSDQGTAIQLVDRMAGPGDAQGSAGHADGRIDAFLDHGQYKVKLSDDPHGTGDAELSAIPSTELEDTPRQLVELKPVDSDLGDHQQRSYWLNIASRRSVAIEASGRYLDDLRLWRDGKWLVDAKPGALVVDPSSGQPLAVRQLAATLEPGLYRLTAYGGQGQKWASESEAKPLHIRYGLPVLAEAGRARRNAGPTGTDRFLVPASAKYFRLDIDQPEHAAISIQPFDAEKPFAGGDNRATIEKNSRDPFAEVVSVSEASQMLVTVERAPGAPYRLTWFDDRQERTAISIHPGDTGWLALYNSGNDTDELDPTAVVTDPKDTVLASTAIKVNKAIAWKRSFNLLGNADLFLEVTEPVDLDVDGSGADAEFRVEPMIAGPHYQAPPDEPSGYVWQVDPGFYRLNIRPRSNGKGVLTLSLHARGTPVPAVEAPRQAAAMLQTAFTHPGTYWIYGNTQANVHSGLRAYRSPIDIVPGISFELAGGQSQTLPVVAGAAGRVSAIAEDGAALPVTVDKGPSDLSAMLAAGPHDITLSLPPGDPRYVAVTFTPQDLQGDAPLPAIDAKLLAGLPDFPVLAEDKPLYIDLAQQQHASFAVPVVKPALYRLESTGIIETAGTLRTRVIPSLDSESANGIGRNFLIQRYLGQGDYQLTVTPPGRSAGEVGVSLSQTPLENFGMLSPGLAARTTLPSGHAGLYTFHIDTAARYHLQTLGLGHQFLMRLEDADGWPLLPPGGVADVTYDFPPGDYRMLLLPDAIENRAVTLLQRIEKPVERSGHGPFAISLGQPMQNRWMEPVGGGTRQPDIWRVSLPAAAEVTIGIDGGMQASLTGKDSTIPRMAEPGKDWKGTLPAGDYELAAVSARPNNRVDYTLSVDTTQMVAGERRGVTAPASIPISIGAGAPAEINSYGDADVKATLYDASGAIVAANDDRDNDWNFSIAQSLAPGDYRLQVDPVGGDSAATEVAIEQPAETTDAAAVLDRQATISDALVHVVPIDPATLKTNSLLAVAADAASPIGLSLERVDGDGWVSVGGASGMNPFVGLPLGDQPAPLRLRIWSRDHTASPLTYTIADVEPPTIGEGTAAKGSTLKPVAALGNKIGAIHIALDNPGVVFAGTSAPDLQASTVPNAATASLAGRQIEATEKDAWLIGRVAGNQAPFQIHRPDPNTGKPLQLTIPTGRDGLVLPVRPSSPGTAALWMLSTHGLGLAAVSPGDLIGIGVSAYGGSEAAHVSVTLPSSESDSVRLSQPDATAQTSDLPVTLQRFEYKVPKSRPLESGIIDGTFGGQDMMRFTLPEGAKTLWLNLPEGTAALLTNDESHSRLLWSWRPRLIEVEADDENGLSLFYTHKSAAAYSLRLLQASPPTLQRNDKPGTLVVLKESDVVGKFTALGAVESMMSVSASGDVTRGTSVPVGKEQYIQATIDFAPGLMGYATLSNELPEGAASVDLDPRLAKRMPLAPVRITAGPARLVRVQADVPAILYQGTTEGNPILPQLLEAGTDYFLLMPEGQSRDLMAIPGDAKAQGAMTLSVLTTTPIQEGLGPKRRIAPGEARAFSFSLAVPRTVGVGVRASVDIADCYVIGPDGTRYGGGKLAMPALPAGTSVLVVDVPVGGEPVEIEPALVGSVAPDNGPPADIRAKYMAMTNQKNSQ